MPALGPRISIPRGRLHWEAPAMLPVLAGEPAHFLRRKPEHPAGRSSAPQVDAVARPQSSCKEQGGHWLPAEGCLLQHDSERDADKFRPVSIGRGHRSYRTARWLWAPSLWPELCAKIRAELSYQRQTPSQPDGANAMEYRRGVPSSLRSCSLVSHSKTLGILRTREPWISIKRSVG